MNDQYPHTWEALQSSIISVMNMNMFGMPFTGVNLCGFDDQESDEELCVRWM
ncbi:MAG: hypothetical protein IPK55_13785 [Streptococcus sp.]|nr:hypothetical protein [Streptococcus sp.]